ncbi:MAG: 50S ribosomal protein L11 methyltransferase, partial [Desulfamplus sp.]|nr:50S ribosomal protein L11 methyltransferase [Desulfamplus sp.]
MERSLHESYGIDSPHSKLKSKRIGLDRQEREVDCHERGSDTLSHNSTFIGNWEEDGFSFLFFSAPCDEAIEQMLLQEKTLTLVDRYEMSGEQWHGERIESYTAGSLCISPPWKIPFVNKPGIKHILLDPGVVFGTGRHPTTEDCLGYIEYVLGDEHVSTVMDIGTGTGLLALAAAALGSKKVLAIDFNLLAVKTTQNNIMLNSFEDKILAIQGRAEDFAAIPADLVVANIHYDVMKQILEIPEFLNHPWLILSGLLRSEVDKVVAHLKKEGVTVIETVSPDGVWNTILAKG